MKLQANQDGAWRDVIHFPDNAIDLKVVAILGRRLIALSDSRCAMRIADDQNLTVEHLGESI